MTKKVIIALVAAAALGLSASAFANGNNNGDGCRGNCSNPPASSNAATGLGVGVGVGVGIGHGGNATGGSATANGGQGGNGGVGIGGSVAGSGNSHNTNINANSASNRNDIRTSAQQGQQQGQLQGQQQGQVATGGSASNGGNTVSGSQANGQTTTVTGDDITYAAQDRNPVSTAYAPNIAPTATCMGSTSGGAQGVGFGISIGSTWTAEECQTLEQGRFAAQVLGQTDVAGEIACTLDKYRDARKRLGKPCGVDKAMPASSATAPSTDHAPKVAVIEYTDPIVRARLGLPPLKN